MRIARDDARIAPDVNSVTLAGIRQVVAEDFRAARTSEGLEARLERKGFMLRRFDGATYLATAPHGKLICDLTALSVQRPN